MPSGGRNLGAEAVRARRPVDRQHGDAAASNNDGNGRIGGDVKYGITQNITADLTVNTDFAQVEVDEQQVNLTRFNLFFPEKRDFFLEGLGTFAFAGRASAGLGAGSGDTPYLFFSRRIGLDQSRVIPILAGGRTTGKAGKFTFGAINVQTGDDEAARIDSANFTVLRAKRDILRRSSIGGMFTHRTATPGRTGANDGYGLDAAMSFYQNVRFDAYLAATETEGRDGDNLSYRGFFDYNADKYGVQAERLVVEPNFLPEIGFVRRTDMRRNFGLLRYSPRPKGVPHLRKLTTQASLNYLTNNQDRLDTREASGRFETEFTNSDLFSVVYTDSFERLVRPFRDCDRRHAADRQLRLSHHAHRLHRRPAAAVFGRGRLRVRHVLQRRPQVDRAQRGAAAGHAAGLAGAELLDQLGRPRARLVHRQGRAHARDVHDHAADVRERHRAVQHRRLLVRQQRALPLGVSSRQRAVRRLHGRLQHRRTAPNVDVASQPRLGRQVQPPVPVVGWLREPRGRDLGPPAVTLDVGANPFVSTKSVC